MEQASAAPRKSTQCAMCDRPHKPHSPYCSARCKHQAGRERKARFVQTISGKDLDLDLLRHSFS